MKKVKGKKKKVKKNKKIISIVSSVIFILLFIVSIILFGIIFKLNIVPFRYFLIIAIIYLLMLTGIGTILLKKKFKSWIKVVMDVISFILIVIFLIILYFLNSTLNFMSQIKAENYQIENYYVLAMNDSEIEEVDDISLLGIYDTDDSNYNNALELLYEKIEVSEEKEYDNYIDLGKSLLNEEVEAIIMSASYKDIVSEIVTNFNDNVKVIHTIELKSESAVEASEKDVTEEAFTIYISGIDVYGDILSISRSDVNMIMTVNPSTNKILLVSIPRDYYVKLHGTSGGKDKLTHAGLYGINMSIETIEDLLEVDIDYYIRVNFTTLINLVDAIGGIDIYSDTAFTAYTNRNCYFKVGNMHLDGTCALAYARERYAYQEGDRHRVRNQQEVLSAIIEKALSSKTLITKYTSILETMSDSFQTNMPSEKIYELINMQLDTMPSWTFDTYSLNGTDSSNATYTFGSQLLYVMEPDEETVIEARNKIDECVNELSS